MTHNRVTLLENFVDRDKRLEGLNLIREDWLNAKSRPKGDRRVVVPGVYDALYVMSGQESLEFKSGTRTANMLLFGCSLIGTGCLLYVDNQFLFRLVFVHWPSRIVYFIAVNVESGTSPPSV
jgi:hypothetical protein